MMEIIPQFVVTFTFKGTTIPMELVVNGSDEVQALVKILLWNKATTIEVKAIP